MSSLTVNLRIGLTAAMALFLAAGATAQGSKSAPLARQLTEALRGASLTAVAVKDASQPDVYIAVMSVPGTLLVVSAKFSVPAALDAKIVAKEYQEVYQDLQGASDAATKVFIQDVNADGLKFKTFDRIDGAAGSTAFDWDWKKAKAGSEQDYQKSFAETDERYAAMLSKLVAAIK